MGWHISYHADLTNQGLSQIPRTIGDQVLWHRFGTFMFSCPHVILPAPLIFPLPLLQSHHLTTSTLPHRALSSCIGLPQSIKPLPENVWGMLQQQNGTTWYQQIAVSVFCRWDGGSLCMISQLIARFNLQKQEHLTQLPLSLSIKTYPKCIGFYLPGSF